MFKIVIIACAILPYPRGEILNTQCYQLKDEWQPTVYGYSSREQCSLRIETITRALKKNYELIELKKYYCEKNKNLSLL